MKPKKESPADPIIITGICQTLCPTRWCCSVRCFVPVPLYPEQVREIKEFCGRNDFYDKTGSDITLKTRENRYCIFFDDQQKECGIYPVRPFDCLIYPFDFHAEGSNARWLIWDCPYSRHLNEDDIEQILTHFETFYAQEFFRIWDYANDTIDPDNPEGFRMLRNMRITPPPTPPRNGEGSFSTAPTTQQSLPHSPPSLSGKGAGGLG